MLMEMYDDYDELAEQAAQFQIEELSNIDVIKKIASDWKLLHTLLNKEELSSETSEKIKDFDKLINYWV